MNISLQRHPSWLPLVFGKATHGWPTLPILVTTCTGYIGHGYIGHGDLLS